MSAALGVSQLKRLEDLVAARTRVADWYLEALEGSHDIVVPTIAKNVDMSWFVFVVRLAESYSRADRDRVIDALHAQGIGCRNYFQPIHLQPFIREQLATAPGQFPVTESVSDRTIALPFFPQMTRRQVHEVVRAVGEAIGVKREG
jgi:perosamine synthetase